MNGPITTAHHNNVESFGNIEAHPQIDSSSYYDGAHGSAPTLSQTNTVPNTAEPVIHVDTK